MANIDIQMPRGMAANWSRLRCLNKIEYWTLRSRNECTSTQFVAQRSGSGGARYLLNALQRARSRPTKLSSYRSMHLDIIREWQILYALHCLDTFVTAKCKIRRHEGKTLLAFNAQTHTHARTHQKFPYAYQSPRHIHRVVRSPRSQTNDWLHATIVGTAFYVRELLWRITNN